jgi:hypothetical protein
LISFQQLVRKPWFLKRRAQSSDACHFSVLVLFQNPIAQSMMHILTVQVSNETLEQVVACASLRASVFGRQ